MQVERHDTHFSICSSPTHHARLRVSSEKGTTTTHSTRMRTLYSFEHCRTVSLMATLSLQNSTYGSADS